MTTRPAITPKMKIACLLHRGEIACTICYTRVMPEDEIEFDHVHGLGDGGPNTHWNLRPAHKACHAKRTVVQTKQRAKIKRLAIGKKPSRNPMKSAKRKWPKRKMGSR